MKRKLEALPSNQLHRIYRRLYNHYRQGDHFGIDWRTLKIISPSAYDVMWAIVEILNNRQNEANSFENIPNYQPCRG